MRDTFLKSCDVYIWAYGDFEGKSCALKQMLKLYGSFSFVILLKHNVRYIFRILKYSFRCSNRKKILLAEINIINDFPLISFY